LPCELFNRDLQAPTTVGRNFYCSLSPKSTIIAILYRCRSHDYIIEKYSCNGFSISRVFLLSCIRVSMTALEQGVEQYVKMSPGGGSQS